MRRLALATASGALLLLPACADDASDSVSSGPQVTFTTAAASGPTSTGAPATEPHATAAATSTVARTLPPTVPPPTTLPLTADQVALPVLVEGLDNPVDLAWRRDDPTLYVVQQPGSIVPVRDGVVGEPVLDIRDSVAFGGEQGLLGLAFHPTEPLAYVNYTDNDGDTVIEEYAVADDGTFDPASARQVLTIDQPYANHNGGDVVFGPDGYLYIGMGDGGSANDPERRALNVSQLLGKILRIDPRASGDQPYTVPADNPFVGVAGARPEIWSVGVRNPWRLNFDQWTGDLWIGDVGQGSWEEIDLARAVDGGGRGVNFGWSAWEGTHRFNSDQAEDGVTMPIFEYPHGADGCSVSGGDVYRGSAVPSLVGWYVFSDYCSGIVTALQATDGALSGQLVLGQVDNVSAICTGPEGEMYVLSVGAGTISQLVAAT